jgi:hypothetical protein
MTTVVRKSYFGRHITIYEEPTPDERAAAYLAVHDPELYEVFRKLVLEPGRGARDQGVIIAESATEDAMRELWDEDHVLVDDDTMQDAFDKMFYDMTMSQGDPWTS